MMRQIDLLFARAILNGQAVAILNAEKKVAFVPMISFHGQVEDTLPLQTVAKQMEWDADWKAQVEKLNMEGGL